MERVAQRDVRALLALLRDLEASSDLRDFPLRAMPALHRLVPYDIATYNEVNPRRERIATVTYPVGSLPADGEARFAPLIRQHPIIRHVQQTGDGQALKLSDFISQRQFHQLGLYQDFFLPASLEHQIALTLPSAAPLVLGIALNRGRGDFSERDRLLLNLLRPHLVQVYQSAAARQHLGQALAAVERALDADSRGLVLLSRTGRRPLLTAQARRWLGEFFAYPVRRSAPLPEVVQCWAERQRAWYRAGDDTLPAAPEPLIVEKAGRRLTVRFLAGAGDDALDALLCSETATDDFATFPESAPLTAREQDVLRLLARGKTNREIGGALGTSTRTVDKHVERLLSKLGVETRTAAAAWAFVEWPVVERSGQPEQR